MEKKLEMLLLTGRSIWQGEAMESGKEAKGYMEVGTSLQMNPEDMAKLGVSENDKVLLTSKYGKVVMKVVPAKERLMEGMVYVPFSTWCNVLVNPTTESTGMPSFKSTRITIEKTKEKIIPTSLDVVKKVYVEGKEL